LGPASREFSSTADAKNLEENDPDQQHVQAVRREREVEPVGREQVHRRPAGKRDEDPEQATDREKHDGDHRIGFDQILGGAVDFKAGVRADTEISSRCRHLACPLHSTT
jgi:hypothetical protein